MPLRDKVVALADIKAGVELGCDDRLALKEAHRCLNCDIGALQGFAGRATCSPATAGAATAGIDQAFPGRRQDISINSVSC